MIQPYFIYRGEKEETIKLPEDISLWAQTIFDTLLKQAPYLAQAQIGVNLFYIDEDKNNAFGTITCSIGNIVFDIPIVITKGQLHPLDVFFYDGNGYPLNADVLSRFITIHSEIGESVPTKIDPFASYRESLPVGYTDLKLPSKRAAEILVNNLINDLKEYNRTIKISSGFLYKVASQQRAHEVLNTVDKNFVLAQRLYTTYPDLLKESHVVAYSGKLPNGVWIFKNENSKLWFKEANDKAFKPVLNEKFMQALLFDKEASYKYNDNITIVDTRSNDDIDYKFRVIGKTAAVLPNLYVTEAGNYYTLVKPWNKEVSLTTVRLINKVYNFNNTKTGLLLVVSPTENSHTVYYQLVPGLHVYQQSETTPQITLLSPDDFESVNHNLIEEIDQVKYFTLPVTDVLIMTTDEEGIKVYIPISRCKIMKYNNGITVLTGQTMHGPIRLVWGHDILTPVVLEKNIEYAPGLYVDNTTTILLPKNYYMVLGRSADFGAPSTVSLPVKMASDIQHLHEISVKVNSYNDWKLDLKKIGGIETDYSLSGPDTVALLLKHGFDTQDIVRMMSEPGEWLVIGERNEKKAQEVEITTFPIDSLLKTAITLGKDFPNIGKLVFSLVYVSPSNINKYNEAIQQIKDALDAMIKFLILIRLGNIDADINSLKIAIEYTADFLSQLNQLPYNQVHPTAQLSQEKEI